MAVPRDFENFEDLLLKNLPITFLVKPGEY